MTLIYVAGPMTGIPEFNYPTFHAAVHRLAQRGHRATSAAHGHDTITPLPAPREESARPYDHYLRYALNRLLACDAVALLPGWENSAGTALEHHVATTLAMPVHHIDYWLNRTKENA